MRFSHIIKIEGQDVNQRNFLIYKGKYEKNMKKELEAFNLYLSRLPFAVQIAVNELMTDVE